MSAEIVEVSASPKKSHLFQKGQSGNVAGRPKGSKNAVTLMKLALEGELRAQLKPEMGEILVKAIELAKKGDPDMIKYLLDKWLTPAKASTDEEAPRERVQILIGRLGDDTPIAGRVVSDQ